MGAGIYAMVFASILMFKVAEADKKRGWLWAGINLCVSMIMGKFFGLDTYIAAGAFVITFLAMFISNIVFPKKLQ
ncbi:hypothetical protein GCM10011613_27920 [Cellvibrio zantedeschiae]|uniref:Uncharacterized protein n=1 Tax=Cellvibrio zantedeschiae TaxID=1237077 RepID=A0ABQ3BAT1_9GAMM|nr:hypothetical protein [Cellvibrio zantedeschiae]GGY81660.1 hypothetical protein GCM10011613_27920 [Cellvibrio zantedeschiae]